MRLAESSREIERHGEIAETRFSIHHSSKAFSVLSSLLYRDKIRAIIRELSCNAYDAHVAAGKADQPFTVHLPNAMEPFFLVRDEGPGLSPNDIETIYTTYFASTKTDSNDFVGALGLGSKSPFSYVDSFTVSSRFNGVQYDYAAFISEEGEPKIARMAQRETQEPNGLEVKLPIKHKSDFDDFTTKAKSVLSYFKVRPVVIGQYNFEFLERDVLVNGNGWRITKSKVSENLGATAIMGCVAYPIVSSAIQTLSKKAISVLSSAIEIDFPIGSLDVTAGREDLSYAKTTLAALERRASEILADAPPVFQAAFDRCKNEYEARMLFSKLFYNSNVGGRLLNLSEYTIQYNGQDITSNAFTLNIADIEGLRIDCYNPTRTGKSSTLLSQNEVCRIDIDECKNVAILVNDVSTASGACLRIRFNRRRQIQRTLIVLNGPEQARQAALDRLEGFPVEYVSDLPLPPSKPKASRSGNASLLTWDFYYSRKTLYLSCFWKEATVDPAVGGLYVHKLGNSAMLEGWVDNEFFTMMRTANELGLISDATPVYGLNKQLVKRCVKTGKWRHVSDHIAEQVRSRLNDSNTIVSQCLAALERDHSYINDIKMRLGILVKELSAEHPLAEFLKDYHAAVQQRTNVLDYKRLMTLCQSLKIACDYSDQSLREKWESLIKKYPLLHIIRPICGWPVDYGHLVKYISWIDGQEFKFEGLSS